jgi:mRNA deadenylase 3'-5' endonuclease subunit Ccr4
MKQIKILSIFLLFCQIILAKTLTIASYNVENLFDLNDDGTEYDVYKPPVWNLTSYKTKLKNIAFVISKINADIISLQEVESKIVMEDLRKELSRAKPKVKYPYFAFEKNKSQAIGVGLF